MGRFQQEVSCEVVIFAYYMLQLFSMGSNLSVLMLAITFLHKHKLCCSDFCAQIVSLHHSTVWSRALPQWGRLGLYSPLAIEAGSNSIQVENANDCYIMQDNFTVKVCIVLQSYIQFQYP